MEQQTAEDRSKRDPRALNAYRHGLTGQVVLRTQGEQEAYDKHCKSIHHPLAPVGGMEIQIAQGIADDQWRLNRGRAIEENGYAMGIGGGDGNTNNHPEIFGAMAIQATWFNDANSIALRSVYSHRLQRDIERSMQQLKQLQAERQAALQKAAEESNLLAELAESKRETYVMNRDFPRQTLPRQFDFSNAEIADLATNLQRLTKAKTVHIARMRFARKAA